MVGPNFLHTTLDPRLQQRRRVRQFDVASVTIPLAPPTPTNAEFINASTTELDLPGRTMLGL